VWLLEFTNHIEQFASLTTLVVIKKSRDVARTYIRFG
jgi:hypothetical protein